MMYAANNALSVTRLPEPQADRRIKFIHDDKRQDPLRQTGWVFLLKAR